MNLIIVIGSGAVGKMTVSQELMKITDYRLFHNHMMIEPVIDIFGKFNGAVAVCSKDLNDLNILTISPIFILPKYQNMGIGYAALKRVFETFPDATKWKLATIQEEPANCHLYEKCGFIRTGESHKVNEDMTLVCYEK